MYAYMHTYTHADTHAYTYVYEHACTQADTHAYTHVDTHAYAHDNTCLCTCSALAPSGLETLAYTDWFPDAQR